MFLGLDNMAHSCDLPNYTRYTGVCVHKLMDEWLNCQRDGHRQVNI